MSRRRAPRPFPPLLLLLLLLLLLTLAPAEGGSWCIARSGSSPESLQTALDYACGAGADCRPVQESGFCFLPNTLQAHASYAFNSFYQRSGYAAGACDFAGTATVTISDPSYGSCTYPATPSSAGGVMTPPSSDTPNVVTTAPITNPPGNVPVNVPTANGTTSPVFGGDDGGGFSPDFDSSTRVASSPIGRRTLLLSLYMSFWFLLLPFFI